MPDRDLLAILDASEVPVLADGTQVGAGDAACLGADLQILAKEPSEMEIKRAVRQQACLDQVRIVNQEQEDVAVRSLERCHLLLNVHARVVHAGGPVEHARQAKLH